VRRLVAQVGEDVPVSGAIALIAPAAVTDSDLAGPVPEESYASRPDSGFATTPTIASPTAAHTSWAHCARRFAKRE
jgi:pyruvate/2-oxoglutarate dehydrogenase complex dihydrolipoamide acyltransferase (E2) component